MRVSGEREPGFLEEIGESILAFGICLVVSLAVVANVQSKHFGAILIGIPVFLIISVLFSFLGDRRRILKKLNSKRTFAIIVRDFGFTESAGLRILSLCYAVIIGFLQGLKFGFFVDAAFVVATLLRGKPLLETQGATAMVTLALILAIFAVTFVQLISRLALEGISLNIRLRDAAIRYLTISIEAGGEKAAIEPQEHGN